MNDLKKDKDITILPADKGCATVILSKVDYIKKCKEHIESGPYETLKRDPTESIKRECLKKLKSLKDRNIIDQSQTQANRLSSTSILWPKIHTFL